MSRGMRGQTTLDFAVGVGVFVVVVAFVFAFAPGMIQPFESSTQEETASINRIADRVVQDLLAEPGAPYALDPWCAVAFLSEDPENTDGNGDYTTALDPNGEFPEEPGDCRWDDDALDERLGLVNSDLNVRIEFVTDSVSAGLDDPDDGSPDNDNERDTACYDYNDDRFVEAGDPFESGTECEVTGGDDRLLAIGPQPPDASGSRIAARRTVRLPGVFDDGTEDGLLVVEVWK